MGIINAKNIFEESYGMFFITGLIGLRPARICKNIFLGYVYVALLLIAYWALYFFTVGDSLELYEFLAKYSKSGRTRTIQTLFNLLYQTIMILSSVINSSKIRNLYNELGVVDEKLKLLNVRMNHGKFTRMDVVRICEIILVTILFNLLEYYSQASPAAKQLYDLAWIVNMFPQFVNSIALGSFVIVIAKIRRRFEAINEYILNMEIFEKHAISTLETDVNNVFRLRLLNKIHEKLINAATNLNEAHELVLLTSFIIYFLTCCAHLRTVSMIFGKSDDIVDLTIETLWVLFYIAKYVYVIAACHSVTLQGKLSGRLLHEKWTDVDHHPLKHETDVLARQIESRNLQLTACNFFVIDYPALKMIIVALAAYLLFVSQQSASCDNK